MNKKTLVSITTKVKRFLFGALLAIIVIGICLGLYHLNRTVNYSLSYKSSVQDQIDTELDEQVPEILCKAIKPDLHAEIFTNPLMCAE